MSEADGASSVSRQRVNVPLNMFYKMQDLSEDHHSFTETLKSDMVTSHFLHDGVIVISNNWSLNFNSCEFSEGGTELPVYYYCAGEITSKKYRGL